MYVSHYHHPAHHSNYFAFDPSANYIFVDASSPRPEQVYNYIHELTHAQLTNGVLGLACLTVSQLLAEHLESPVYNVLSSPLHEQSETSADWKALRHYLITRDPRLAEVWPRERRIELLATIRGSLASALSAGASPIADYKYVAKRLRAIQDSWRFVQEGLATYAPIACMLSPSELTGRLVDEAIAELQVPLAERKSVLDELREMAEEDLAACQSGEWKQELAEGVGAFLSIEQQAGSSEACWAAAFACSHFPYQCCPLLNMSEDRFDRWVQGSFNSRSKLLSLQEDATVLVDFVREPFSGDCRVRLLKCLDENAGSEPISERSRYFELWERDHLWRSDLMKRLCGEGLEVGLAKSPEPIHPSDRTLTFDHSIEYRPGVIFSDGRVRARRGGSSATAIRLFCNKFEHYRTSEMLRDIEAAASC